ncbi:MAG: HupE/UreJ family protein [Pseudomonadota bacterium]
MIRLLALIALLLPTAALAHPGHDEAGLMAGLQHPMSGLDHIAVMIAVGLWAALAGGRALWVWPATFVGVMLVGGALGMAHVALPLVEPGILASVVVLGLMVALAIDLPVAAGAALIGVFALFHGHAHGAEVPEAASSVTYLLGFAATTAALHGVGIGLALALNPARARPLVRLAGAVCVAVGLGLATGVI